MRPKVIAMIVVAVLCVIVLVQNIEVVNFNIFFWQIGMSKIIMLFLTLVVGFAIGFIAKSLIGRYGSGKN